MADSAVTALNSLLRTASIDDHEEALRLANSAIKSSKPGSAEQLLAHHTKAVSLLQLDRFEDALRAIAAAGAKHEEQCLLEKTYALYKTGQLDEAEALLKSKSLSSRGLQHVAAQVAYRSEKFAHAAATYRELATVIDGAQYGEENDLRINLQATNAQLEWQGNGHLVPENQRQPGRDELEAFETSYNAACGCLARGDFAKAAVLLKRSKDLCEASEDLSDEEKRIEIVPIIVQQAYVSSRLGKTDEAASLQKSIKLPEVPDSSTKALAYNNTLVLKAESNPFMTQRLAEMMPTVAANDRLFEYQASVLRRNKYIIQLQAEKFTGVQKTTGNILDNEPGSAVSAAKASLGVLHAGARAHLQTGKEAIRRILPLLDTRPDDVGLLLTIIQLYVQTKNPGPALSLLEAFFKRLEAATKPDHADVRFAPGLVALAVSLYRLQGRHGAIRTELAKAAAHWEQASDETTTTTTSSGSLLREAGIELLSSPNPSDLAVAGTAFERLTAAASEEDRADRAATAGLVASFATSDFAKVKPHLSSLTPADRLAAGIDVAALLRSGVASLPVPAAAAAASATKRARADEDAATTKQPAAKRARKRRVRLPKDYDPSKKPDPERWLPLRDRSSYRPKGRKGRKRAAEATQGGVVRGGDQETLELVGGAGAVKVEKAGGASGAGAAAGAAGGSAGGGAGGAGKKKQQKKKGKR